MNTQVEQSQAQNEQAEVTLGEKFRQAREALNLSLEDVSKQIALRPSIFVQIENNEFIQKNVPATFVKGYVRSYGKFLRLPESLWNDLSFGETEQIDLDKNVRATRSVNQYSLHNRWIGYLTVLVLFVALSMTGLWWWHAASGHIPSLNVPLRIVPLRRYIIPWYKDCRILSWGLLMLLSAGIPGMNGNSPLLRMDVLLLPTMKLWNLSGLPLLLRCI